MSKKVVTFGEMMMRLSPPGYRRIVQADSFDVTYAGGEVNVAASLAAFGFDAYFVTKVPKNEVGQASINYLRRFGIRTDHILRGGPRLGIYFLENGASQRASKVIYDRANSSIALMEPDEVNWDEVFSGADWFHFTGITPALGDKPARTALEGAKRAKELGLTVSMDLNYRKNLWSEAKAREVVTGMVPYIDMVIANEEDADKVLGVKAADTDVNRGQLSEEGYKEVASILKDRFGFKMVGITLRQSISASDNTWSGLYYDGKDHLFSAKYNVHIVDRLGGGDSFAAGLIYGILSGWPSRDTVEFAAAASCLKHSIFGDFNHVTVDEVKSLVKEGGSGRVQR